MDSAIGQTFGAYRIESLLTSRVSASLYRATSVDETEPVAVKIIDQKFVESTEQRQNLLSQAARAQDLLHPNLIEIRDIGQEHGVCYLVMEFCPHGSVRTLQQRARGTGQAIPVALCLDLVRQAADAVAFLATHGICLVSLQPDSLMLKASGGNANFGHWTIKLDPVEVPLLPVYGPLLPADDAATDEAACERASVRNLGLVLYELLTGIAPSDWELGEFKPPSIHRPGLAEEIDTILIRCLGPDTADRFSSLDEFIAAIDEERLRYGLPPERLANPQRPVLEVQRLGLDLRPLGSRGARQRVYQLDLRNRSSTIAHVTFRAHDDHDALRYQFAPEMVTVEPGKTRTIVLTVRDKRRRAEPVLVDFLVVATPGHGPAVASHGEFERAASRSFKGRQALAGFGALGLTAIVLLAMMFGTLLQSAAPAAKRNATPTALATTRAVVNLPAFTPSPTPTIDRTTTPTPAMTPSPTPTIAPATGTPLTVRRISTTTNDVALTFSISNDPSVAGEVRQILQILADRNVHATFGLSGDWAQQNPEVVKTIVAGGHQIINETYDHRSFTGESEPTGPLSSAQRVDELVRADRVIRQIAGYQMSPYYRPPFGDMQTTDGTSVANDAKQAGYSVAVLWSIDTKSWDPQETVGKMISDASAALPGDVVLFSITSSSPDKDVSALPQVIDNLQAHGRGFATVKELVGR